MSEPAEPTTRSPSDTDAPVDPDSLPVEPDEVVSGSAIADPDGFPDRGVHRESTDGTNDLPPAPDE
jgi:hypothetical protein